MDVVPVCGSGDLMSRIVVSQQFSFELWKRIEVQGIVENKEHWLPGVFMKFSSGAWGHSSKKIWGGLRLSGKEVPRSPMLL